MTLFHTLFLFFFLQLNQNLEIARKIGMVTLNSVTTIKKQFYGADMLVKNIFSYLLWSIFTRLVWVCDNAQWCYNYWETSFCGRCIDKKNVVSSIILIMVGIITLNSVTTIEKRVYMVKALAKGVWPHLLS